jgi:hypothetical protein
MLSYLEVKHHHLVVGRLLVDHASVFEEPFLACKNRIFNLKDVSDLINFDMPAGSGFGSMKKEDETVNLYVPPDHFSDVYLVEVNRLEAVLFFFLTVVINVFYLVADRLGSH